MIELETALETIQGASVKLLLIILLLAVMGGVAFVVNWLHDR